MPPKGHVTHHVPIDGSAVLGAKPATLRVQCRDHDAFGKFCGVWFEVVARKVGISYRPENARMTHEFDEFGELHEV